MAYKPYGEMVQLGLVGGASVSEVREKFTSKEFDTEGSAVAMIEFDIHIAHTSQGSYSAMKS